MLTKAISDIQHLINFRQTLHQNPELSGNEEYTAEALKRMVIRYQPDDVIDGIGGYGVAFVFKGKQEGPTVMFRADMDALPIVEINNFDYSSRTKGVAHQCGHDGHMSILVGVADQISKNRPEKGRIVLLFQPSEETGDGALAVINDYNFKRIEPDYCFALHNIPGFKKGSILLKNGTFSAASQGLVVKLKGKTSHAAEPEKGVSPSIALAQIIEQITDLPNKSELFTNFVLTTIVHAILGERTFGTTPGTAEIMITLRAFTDEDMTMLIEHSQGIINTISKEQNLEVRISNRDIYPLMDNNPALVAMVNDAAKKMSLNVTKLTQPFPWAEDFAHFSQKYKTMMFGIGAGEDSPKLHNADYDFPDEIINQGIVIFSEIYRHIFELIATNEY